jgi:ribosomal protein L14E/L6E/L27E
MCIEDAIHNAKIDDKWVKPFDVGKVKCVVRYRTNVVTRLIDGQIIFEVDSGDAENEVKTLWEKLWNKKLEAASEEAVTCCYIRRAYRK